MMSVCPCRCLSIFRFIWLASVLKFLNYNVALQSGRTILSDFMLFLWFTCIQVAICMSLLILHWEIPENFQWSCTDVVPMYMYMYYFTIYSFNRSESATETRETEVEEWVASDRGTATIQTGRVLGHCSGIWRKEGDLGCSEGSSVRLGNRRSRSGPGHRRWCKHITSSWYDFHNDYVSYFQVRLPKILHSLKIQF